MECWFHSTFHNIVFLQSPSDFTYIIKYEEMNEELQSACLKLVQWKMKFTSQCDLKEKNNLYCPFTLNKWSAILAYKNYNEPYLKHFWISNKYFAFQKCSNFCRNLPTMSSSFIFDISSLEKGFYRCWLLSPS